MELKFRLLKADEINVRVQQCGSTQKGAWASFLLYKDARCDMNILDETVGCMNWQKHYLRENANCIVSIYDDEKSQWIEKEDTGVESNTEAEKGLASDSFKRACFNWGIGRELYTSPKIFVSLNEGEFYDKNGKPQCKLSLSCSDIAYDENRNIIKLVLVDDKGKVRFNFAKETKEPKSLEELTKLFKELVNKLVVDFKIDISSSDFTNFVKREAKVDDFTLEKLNQEELTRVCKIFAGIIKRKEAIKIVKEGK